MSKYADFYQSISYHFTNEELLITALTHPSLKNKNNHNYERLEFLGDKVLGLVISEFLIEKFPDNDEGELSKRQAQIVAGRTLCQIAQKLNLQEMMLVSFGEKKIGGNYNNNNLENALEALIGAIYLDSNLAQVKKFILHFWHDFLYDIATPSIDYISSLQETVQAYSKKLPQYNTQKKGGSEHAPVFFSILKIPNLEQEFYAEGNSKKSAQRNVAKIAVEYLKNHPNLKK